MSTAFAAGRKRPVLTSAFSRHNNKAVDLSKPLRLSGLSSGAKLELVQLSKSAGVVSIALQLPPSEAGGATNARLTDKFSSSTTLWQLLRKFEAGVAGGNEPRNFTARGVPATSQGNSGAGRLFYEQPVIHIMNRELASFTDLQKSLAQLGFNTGSALLRLSFRTTETPLEEAMVQIQEYFTSIEGQGPPAQSSQKQPIPLSSEPATTAPQQQPEWEGDTPSESTIQPQSESSAAPSSQTQTVTSATGRPISVYRPPTASTPSAALMSHNDADYTPTVEHAQIHQKLLQQNSRNVRLKTEAELAAQADEEAAKWAAVKDVEIKIRFPDQSAVVTTFGQSDTAADLYTFVRADCLEDQWHSEAFFLRMPGVKGKSDVIADDSSKTLIKSLQLKGRILLTFAWDDQKASIQARSTKSVLKPERRAQAEELRVVDVSSGSAYNHDPGVPVNVGKKESGASEDGGQGKSKMPKWLKGLSKK